VKAIPGKMKIGRWKRKARKATRDVLSFTVSEHQKESKLN